MTTRLAAFDRIRCRHHDAGVFLYAFDLIELNGDDLRNDPLEVRKVTLAMLGPAAAGLRLTSTSKTTARPCSNMSASLAWKASCWNCRWSVLFCSARTWFNDGVTMRARRSRPSRWLSRTVVEASVQSVAISTVSPLTIRASRISACTVVAARRRRQSQPDFAAAIEPTHVCYEGVHQIAELARRGRAPVDNRRQQVCVVRYARPRLLGLTKLGLNTLNQGTNRSSCLTLSSGSSINPARAYSLAG